MMNRRNRFRLCARQLVLAAALTGGLSIVAGCRAHRDGPPVVAPHEIAVSETLPLQTQQSAAIWMHPTDPAGSLLLVPNPEHGLQVHSLDGTLVSHIGSMLRASAVGVIYNFSNNGKSTDLAVVARAAKAESGDQSGVSLLEITPEQGVALRATNEKPIDTFTDATGGGKTPALLCTYRSHVTGRRFFFAAMRDGRVEQWEITATPDQPINAKQTRSFTVGGDLAGITADDDAGVIYVADRSLGVRQFNAEPQMPLDAHVAIPLAGAGNGSTLKGVGSIAIFSAAGGQGYLLAVNPIGPRGATRIDLFDRTGEHPLVASISPPPVAPATVSRAAGIVATNGSTNADLPNGVIGVGDTASADGGPTFRLYSWSEIAKAAGLIVDPDFSPRPVLYRRN